MRSVAITNYVYGSYTKYIPLYIYAAATNWKARKFIFLVDERPREAELAKRISERLQVQVEFRLVNEAVPSELYQKIKRNEDRHKHVKPALRYFANATPQEDYVYIGDIDIIAYSGSRFFDYHIKRMRTTALGYSNAKRPGEDRYTGLHFSDSIFSEHDYDLAINLIDRRLESGHLYGFDEKILFEYVNQRFGETPDVWRPYCGFHFARYRGARALLNFDRPHVGARNRPRHNIHHRKVVAESVRRTIKAFFLEHPEGRTCIPPEVKTFLRIGRVW